MRYHLFDLAISATSQPFAYQLFAQSSTQGEAAAPTTFDAGAPPLATWLQQLADENISASELQALGLALYQALFVGDINLLWQRAFGETLAQDEIGLRLRLRINPAELAALPWEFLYSPERQLFLAASVETPVSRYINLGEPLRQLACPEKINLLAVIPQNTDLDVAAERDMLAELAKRLAGKMTVDALEGPATQKAIRAALRRKAYHIVHYAGHGSFENEQAFIHLDHEWKSTEPMDAALFAHFFTDYPPARLIFLNACQGATRSAHQALVGLAPQLVRRGVPAVLAMQYRIDNDDAMLFAAEFYAELCNTRDGGQVEVALSRARKALLQERPGSPAFGNPVLYLRADDGRLWQAKAAAEAEISVPSGRPKLAEKKSLLERWQLWVGIIGGILVIIGGLLDLPEKVNKFLGSKKTSDSTQTVPAVVLQQLRGQIRDATTGRYLDGVIVILPELGKRATTNDIGVFEFDSLEVPASAPISLQATKPGYVSINDDPWPGTQLNQYKMKREK
jgi:hypothetical protein